MLYWIFSCPEAYPENIWLSRLFEKNYKRMPVGSAILFHDKLNAGGSYFLSETAEGAKIRNRVLLEKLGLPNY